MQQLHLVGFTTDLEGLIFSARRGAKSGSFVVKLDEQLLASIEEARRHHDGDDEGGTRATASDRSAPPARRPRPESLLSPREIQAALRAGASIADVAASAGVDEEWVARFAVPIAAEQHQVVLRARELVLSKARLGPSAHPLGTSVLFNLVDRGVRLTEAAYESAWRARNLHGATWVVTFEYTSRRRTQAAEWEVDLRGATLHARNRVATDLGYVEPGRRRRAVPAFEPPEHETPTTAGRTSRARKKAGTAAPARPATSGKRTAKATKAAKAAKTSKAAKTAKATKAAKRATPGATKTAAARATKKATARKAAAPARRGNSTTTSRTTKGTTRSTASRAKQASTRKAAGRKASARKPAGGSPTSGAPPRAHAAASTTAPALDPFERVSHIARPPSPPARPDAARVLATRSSPTPGGSPVPTRRAPGPPAMERATRPAANDGPLEHRRPTSGGGVDEARLRRARGNDDDRTGGVPVRPQRAVGSRAAPDGPLADRPERRSTAQPAARASASASPSPSPSPSAAPAARRTAAPTPPAESEPARPRPAAQPGAEPAQPQPEARVRQSSSVRIHRPEPEAALGDPAPLGPPRRVAEPRSRVAQPPEAQPARPGRPGRVDGSPERARLRRAQRAPEPQPNGGVRADDDEVVWSGPGSGEPAPPVRIRADLAATADPRQGDAGRARRSRGRDRPLRAR